MAKTKEITEKELMALYMRRAQAFEAAHRQLVKCKAGDASTSAAGEACAEAARACIPEHLPSDDQIRDSWEQTAKLVRKPEQDWYAISETNPMGEVV